MRDVRLAGLRTLAAAVDALCLGAAWLACIQLRIAVGDAWSFDLFPGTNVLKEVDPFGAARRGFLIVPMFLGVLWARGRWHALRRATLELPRTTVSVAIALIAAQALLFLAALPGPRTLVLGFAIAAVPTLAIARAVQLLGLRGLRRQHFDPHHTVVLGPDSSLAAWRSAVAAHPEWGVQEVAHSTPDALPAILGHRPVDEVVVAGLSPEALADVAAQCEQLGVPLTLDARFVGPRTAAHLHDLDGLPVVTFGPASTSAERLAKRALDLTLAMPLLLVASPILAVAAVLVRLQDGGPALLAQPRVGRHGRLFTMLKLRTMVVGAETAHESLRDSDAPAFKPKSDPRITGIGRWLRRLSIDELPQLLNVLRGEMSLVGPRPPLPSEVVRYERWQLRRLSVPPGMTGLWQVSGRSNLSFERWMALDLEYVDRWSLALDLWLLARTLPAVLRGTGAR